jgi:hypothetical protein
MFNMLTPSRYVSRSLNRLKRTHLKKMHRPLVTFFALSLLGLSSCSDARTPGSGGVVTPFVGTAAGNEVGGVVPLSGTTKEQALKIAQIHCSQYGHSARIISIRAEDGGKAVFECF